jgi:two-component system chemotaxis response regulator CheB
MPLAPGNVYIGKGDADVIISMRPDGPVVMPAPSSPEHRWHPSVDRLVESAMQHYVPRRLVGVLMTGMGNDGAEALARLKEQGGRTIAEAEESAVVWGMPGELVRRGGAEVVAPLEQIADRLMDMVERS